MLNWFGAGGFIAIASTIAIIITKLISITNPFPLILTPPAPPRNIKYSGPRKDIWGGYLLKELERGAFKIHLNSMNNEEAIKTTKLDMLNNWLNTY